MNQKGGRSATLERWADKVEDVLRPHACGLTHAQVADKACLSISTTSKALAASAKRGGVIFMRLRVSRQICLWLLRSNIHRKHGGVNGLLSLGSGVVC